MKIKFKLIILPLLCCLLLSSCASSGYSRYEQSYIDEAKKVLTEFNLSGDAKMEDKGKMEGYKRFDLIVESEDFEALPNHTKISVLTRLNDIDIPLAGLLVLTEVISHENRYDYYETFDSLYKNSELINSPLASSASSSSSSSWFSGGTLHKSYVAEWRKASYTNRLATAADFVAATQEVDYSNLNEFKAWATDLETCISTAVSGGDVDTELVSFISSLCTVQLFP